MRGQFLLQPVHILFYFLGALGHLIGYNGALLRRRRSRIAVKHLAGGVVEYGSRYTGIRRKSVGVGGRRGEN